MERTSSTERMVPEQAAEGVGQLAKTVLRKIDRTIIPLLFVTYMFNFMDKVILSSAAVFGLRDDTVGTPQDTFT